MKQLIIETPFCAMEYGAAGRLPDGRVVFVQGAAPQDRVRVELTQERAAFARATCLEVIEPSPHRTSPFCQYFGRCGGCQWQHVSYARQCLDKKENIERAFLKNGIAVECLFHPSPCQSSCRSRVRMHFTPQTGLGFFEMSSRRLVGAIPCAMLDEQLSGLLDSVNTSGRNGADILEVEANSVDNGVLLSVLCGHKQDISRLIQLFQSLPGLIGIEVKNSRGQWKKGEGVGVLSLKLEAVALYSFPVALGAFMQANHRVNAQLLNRIIFHVQNLSVVNDGVMELFCGSGNISFALAALGYSVVAVENNQRAVQAARDFSKSLASQKCPEFVLGDAMLARPDKRVLVLDPPRAGAGPVIASLASCEKCKVAVYVSCNPWTLARDAKNLMGLGFKLVALEGFDMFPQTCHQESLAVFSRE